MNPWLSKNGKKIIYFLTAWDKNLHSDNSAILCDAAIRWLCGQKNALLSFYAPCGKEKFWFVTVRYFTGYPRQVRLVSSTEKGRTFYHALIRLVLAVEKEMKK